MITTAARVAVLPLRRRVIGSLVVVAGVLIVLAGFFVRLFVVETGTPTSTAAPALAFGTDPASPIQMLRHLIDHGISGDTTIQKAADAGLRGGVALMALAAALALLLLMGPARGLVGLVAGLGIFGAAVAVGIVAGDNTRLSDFTNGNLHLTVGGAGIICALGFAAIIVGGAMAAVRPLAGLFSGISLAVTGVVAAVFIAIVVGGDRIATALHG